jgi:hypothetical protein
VCVCVCVCVCVVTVRLYDVSSNLLADRVESDTQSVRGGGKQDGQGKDGVVRVIAWAQYYTNAYNSACVCEFKKKMLP